MPSPFHPRQTGARGRGRGRVCGHRARHRPPPRRAAAGCPRCWRWTLATRPRSAGKLPWPCRPACNPARPAPACPPCLSLITCAPELGTPRSHAQSLPTCAAPNAQMLALAGPAGLRGPFEPQAPRSGRQPDGPPGSSGSPSSPRRARFALPPQSRAALAPAHPPPSPPASRTALVSRVGRLSHAPPPFSRGEGEHKKVTAATAVPPLPLAPAPRFRLPLASPRVGPRPTTFIAASAACLPPPLQVERELFLPFAPPEHDPQPPRASQVRPR